MNLSNAKLILSIFVLLVFTQNTFAQRGERGANFDKLKQELNLTDDQVSKIESINVDAKEKMIALRKSEDTDKREKMKALRAEKEAAMRAILTEEQAEKLDALQTERKENRKAKFEARKDYKEANKDKFKSMRLEMKRYYQEMVYPTLIEKRTELDRSISADDKTTINELRALVQKDKAEMKARKKASSMEGKSKDGKASKFKMKTRKMPHNRGMKHTFKHNDEARTTLKNLASKYENEIKSIHEELEPTMKEWKQFAKDTKQKYLGDMPEGMHEKHKKHRHTDGEHKEGKHMQRHAEKSMMKKAAFLLLDPNVKIATDELIFEGDTPAQKGFVNAFPNPAAESQTIEFEVLESGKVVVDIVDKTGKVINNVFNGVLEAGTQKVNVNLQNIGNDIYFYRISDAIGTRSHEIIVKK